MPAGNAPDTAPIGNAACAGGGAAGGTGNAPAGIAPGWCFSDAQLGVLATRVEADSWIEAFYALRSAFAHETAAHSWRKVNIAAEAARLGGGSWGMRVGVGAQGSLVALRVQGSWGSVDAACQKLDLAPTIPCIPRRWARKRRRRKLCRA